MRALLLASLLALAGCSGKDSGGGNGTSSTVAGPPAENVEAVNLFLAFDGDAAAAGRRYKGKLVRVSGRVERVQPLVLGFGVVDGPNHPPNVECKFNSADRQELAKVKKGQRATAYGTCTGTRAESGVWHRLVVTVDDCRLAE
jgi:hypothetical protein